MSKKTKTDDYWLSVHKRVTGTDEKTIEHIELTEDEKARRRLLLEVNDNIKYANSYINKASNCKGLGRDFLLTLDNWVTLQTESKCAYSGAVFGGNDKQRTIERVNPFIGYTEENTLAVTKECNDHKSKLDEFLKLNMIPDDMKLKLLRKAVYLVEKKLKKGTYL